MNIIIVGGGIAGLAAGVFARQSGIEATIMEMHTIPGGNSTSWKRKGYLFEGGMHWLVGSGESAPMHQVWKDIGALQANNPVEVRDPFLCYRDEKEGQICLYANPDKLYEHLVSISPEDKDAIEMLTNDIRRLSRISMPVIDAKGVSAKYPSKMSFGPLLKMIPALPTMKRLGDITIGEYLSKFRHPGIRELLKSVVYNEEYAATAIAFTLAGSAVGDSGYPKGGSLRMAQNIADTFLELGGVINYKSKVEKVEIVDGKARGVWVDGKLHEADAVIVAADTLVAIDNLFDQPLHEEWMDELRKEIEPINCTFVSLGIKADLSHVPQHTIFPLEKPFDHMVGSQSFIGINNYAGFEGYAPEGCTAVTVFFGEDTYDQWKEAKENGTYKQAKEAFAHQVIECIAQVLPETEGKVEVWDVATPLTYERYCGTYRGSWMSIMKPNTSRQQYPCKSESVEGLYFAGQRLTLPGGLPVAGSTARDAVQNICKDRNFLFQGEYDR